MKVRYAVLIVAGLLAMGRTGQADTNLVITGFADGMLTWTNPDTNLFYTVEWRPSLTSGNGWTNSYGGLHDVNGTGTTLTVPVPVFYRIAGSSNRTVNPGRVPQTGQTNEYRTGDNGTYQKGVTQTPRFTDNKNGTVTDNLTGLMWTKTANVFGAVAWSTAVDDCEAYSLAGYDDWRLPNARELFSLVDFGQYGPALPESHPFDISGPSYSYWSSTSYKFNGDEYAWRVLLDGGTVTTGGKTTQFYVWPVRGGK